MVCPLWRFDITLFARIVTELLARRGCAVVLALLIAACSSEAAKGTDGSSKRASSRARVNDSAAGAVDLGGPAYKPGPLGAVGSISGTIKLDGVPPVDSTPITVDTKVCGTKAEGSVDATAKGLADVIVWVSDAKTGKPLTINRRLELSSEKCQLDPRIQAAVVGSTVNVFNDDKLLHRLSFISASTGDTLQVMPFFNSGQVVASEKLAKSPGIVEVRCAQHPWSRAYLAVFDHPYYAVTERDGAFTIDSLPPGKYTVNAWHEGMREAVKQQVEVGSGGVARVDMGVTLERAGGAR